LPLRGGPRTAEVRAVGVYARVAPALRGWHRWRAAAGRRAREAGASLVEVSVALAMVGVALTAIVTAMGSTAKMSDVAATDAKVESEARRVAEAARAAPMPTSPCAVPADGANRTYYNCVIPRVAPVPAGWTAQTTSVECGTFTAGVPQFTGTNGACGSMPDFQRVTIKVTAPGGLATSVRFVVRRP
jgi:Tfp pilus assembly protein PilV